MATGDFQFSISLKGNREEVSNIIYIMTQYIKGVDGISFAYVNITNGRETVEVDGISEDKFNEIFAENKELIMTGSGPYGEYEHLNEIKIFERMADVAPYAELKGELISDTSYSEESLSSELKDGILHLKTFYAGSDEAPDAYLDYFLEKLPYKKFIKLFRIDKEDFDEEDYEDFVDDVFVYSENSISGMEADDIVNEINADCGFTDDEDDEVMAELEALNIISYTDFKEANEIGETKECLYNPISKKYENL